MTAATTNRHARLDNSSRFGHILRMFGNTHEGAPDLLEELAKAYNQGRPISDESEVADYGSRESALAALEGRHVWAFPEEFQILHGRRSSSESPRRQASNGRRTGLESRPISNHEKRSSSLIGSVDMSDTEESPRVAERIKQRWNSTTTRVGSSSSSEVSQTPQHLDEGDDEDDDADHPSFQLALALPRCRHSSWFNSIRNSIPFLEFSKETMPSDMQASARESGAHVELSKRETVNDMTQRPRECSSASFLRRTSKALFGYEHRDRTDSSATTIVVDEEGNDMSPTSSNSSDFSNKGEKPRNASSASENEKQLHKTIFELPGNNPNLKLTSQEDNLDMSMTIKPKVKDGMAQLAMSPGSYRTQEALSSISGQNYDLADSNGSLGDTLVHVTSGLSKEEMLKYMLWAEEAAVDRERK